VGEARYLTAREAAEELGVSLATLYAYVSRGRIRSESAGGRSRRYRAEDVRRLKARKEWRRDPGAVVEGALSWGTPVMESAITLVTDDGLYYRGRDAVVLSAGSTVEEVAALIWTGDPARAAELFPAVLEHPPDVPGGLRPVEAFQVLLPMAGAADPAAYDLRPEAVARTGAALILCADHELPVSTFAARCVASSEATPYAVTAAGLAALGGIRHGGQTELVEAFLGEVEAAGAARAAISGRLRRGEGIPGFGHSLYPSGDPRGAELLRATAAAYSTSPALALSTEVAGEVLELIGERPTVDFGLVTLARTLGLPAGGAVTLFALGRTIGWIGHAIEQYESGSLIRPRARYVGR
jgi:citrate synthase